MVERPPGDLEVRGSNLGAGSNYFEFKLKIIVIRNNKDKKTSSSEIVKGMIKE